MSAMQTNPGDVQPTIIDAGLSEIVKPMATGMENLAAPYNCIPIYFNDDDAQAELIHRAKVNDLGAVVYISNRQIGPDQAQFGWLIFRQSIKTLKSESVAYHEWDDFIFDSDYVLPVNLQVNSHDDQDFIDGTGNANDGPVLNAAAQCFGRRFAIAGSGSELIKGLCVDGSYTGFDHAGAIDASNLSYRNGILHVADSIAKATFNKLTGFTVACRNAMLTAFASNDQDIYQFLNMLEQMYYYQLFNDQHYDTYIDQLNQYLGDDHDDVINEDFNAAIYTASQNYVTYFGWLLSCLMHPFKTNCHNLNWLRLTYLMIVPAYVLLGYGWAKMNLWLLSSVSFLMIVLMILNYVLLRFQALPNMSDEKVQAFRDLARNQNVSVNLQAIVWLALLEFGVNVLSSLTLNLLTFWIFLIVFWYLTSYGVVLYYQQNKRSKGFFISMLISYYSGIGFFSYWIVQGSIFIMIMFFSSR